MMILFYGIRFPDGYSFIDHFAASQGGVGSPEVQLAPRGAGWFYPPSQGFKETCN